MDFIQIYNPANARNLTPEQVEAMRDLTDDQIKQLAEAYPNQPTGNAYLMYYIKGDGDKQRYPLGTWKNLANLRGLGKKDIVPFGYKAGFKAQITKINGKNVAVSQKQRVVDISKGEKLEGLKTDIDVKDTLLTKDEFLEAVENTAVFDKTKQAVNNTGETTTILTDPLINKATVAENPLMDAVKSIEIELAQATEDKAHHMTIKSIEKKLAEAKAAAGI